MSPIWYTLLSLNGEFIAEGKITQQIDDVDDLKRAVYSANDTSLPSNYRYTHLHVYPPGTTEYIEQSECTAEDTIRINNPNY